VGDLLAATTAGAEVLGVLALDESGADALSGRGRGRVDKAMLTRSARELAGTMVTQRYGLIQPTQQYPQQAPPQPPQPLWPSAPIAPTAVHPAGTGEVPVMPPNLTSVPHPGAQPPQPNPAPGQYRNPSPDPNQNPNPYTQYPYPPTVSGSVG
jgi:hypothetical protein